MSDIPFSDDLSLRRLPLPPRRPAPHRPYPSIPAPEVSEPTTFNNQGGLRSTANTRPAESTQDHPPRTSSQGALHTFQSAENDGLETARAVTIQEVRAKARVLATPRANRSMAGPSTIRSHQAVPRSTQQDNLTSMPKDILAFQERVKKEMVDAVNRLKELDKLMAKPHIRKTLAAGNLTNQAQLYGDEALLKQQTEDIQTVWGIADALGRACQTINNECDQLKDKL